jgi:hypothetical protein
MNMDSLKNLIFEGQRFKDNLKVDYNDEPVFVNETLREDFLVWARKVLTYIEAKQPNSENGKEIRERLKLDQERCHVETYRLIMSIIMSMEKMESPREQNSQNNSVLYQILYGFGSFVRQLNRRYNNRQGIIITDEYDVQDLLHAQLVAFFEDVRKEDPVPICAGASSRVDFYIADIRTAIEVKLKRKDLDDNTLGKQLLDDVGKYSKRADVENVVFFIFDPDHLIVNPSGMKRDVELSSRPNYKINIVIVS